MKIRIIIFILLIFSLSVSAIQNIPVSKINPQWISGMWDAYWIAYPGESGLDYGVYHFRKTFSLPEKPDSFIIHVSADNRYRLFVNGLPVCEGPARGDLMHWNFESVDIASFLHQGDNLLAAEVWNFADLKPWAQISHRTGFILQGNSDKEKIVDTGSAWRVMKDEAYTPAPAGSRETNNQFIVVGPCDRVDGSKYPWGWETPRYNDSGWNRASELMKGRPKEIGTDIEWGLQPSRIPLMESELQRFSKIRKVTGAGSVSDFISGKHPLVVDPGQKVTILLDQGKLTKGYPELITNGGTGSQIKLTYAESLFDINGQKGNRDQIDSKQIVGYSDYFLPDGAADRWFRPLWIRTWRYVQIEIKTAGDPLTIEDFRSQYSGYPLHENASFESDDPELSRIWDTGWRTARLCAGETYFDCPYYEQLQYVGDTRIQALISLYVSGDDRLVRQAITAYDNSRFSEGLTMSRYPSAVPQVIPTYSLFWIDMVHDYWMLRNDTEFVKSFFPGINQVLDFFIRHIDPQTGLIGKTGYWNFVDWADEWSWDNARQTGGVPKGGFSGQSSLISMQIAYSARHAADLFDWAGNSGKAEYYRAVADHLIQAVKEHCWDQDKGYFASTPDKAEFAMHTQIFAVLTDAIDPDKQKEFVTRFMNDTTLIQPTLYFRFYLTRALKKSGLADRYLETLGLWKDMLNEGLTTFAERPDPTRSDCHAWSASPNYDFLATVAGIEPAEPGFKSVKIEPHLGKLTWIKGQMPHPGGAIRFDLKRAGDEGISGTIELPAGVNGIFIWRSHKIILHGKTEIDSGN